MVDNKWFEEQEKFFKKKYKYEIHPDSQAPFGTMFLHERFAIRQNDLSRLFKDLHKNLEGVFKSLDKFNKKYPLLHRATLNPFSLIVADHAFQICLNHFGRINGRSFEKLGQKLGDAWFALKSILPLLKEGWPKGKGIKGGGRPIEEEQGDFIFNLSAFFIQTSGVKKGEVDWNDCKKLLEYYCNYYPFKCYYLKPLLKLELKRILSGFKKKFPNAKYEEEFLNYRKSPNTYKLLHPLINTQRECV